MPSETHGPSLPGITMATSTEARVVVDKVKVLRSSVPPVIGARKTARLAPRNVAVLADSFVDDVHNDGISIRPHFRGAASTTAVNYPPTSNGKRTLTLKSGEPLSIDVPGTSAATAEYANGYLVYRNPSGGGGDTLVRPTREGFEDYFFFERKPSTPTIEYTITLPHSVAGVRLSSNVLELVDAQGTPLVHASPPFLVDSEGKTTKATLSVAGCAVDRSAQPSWHRQPVPPGATSCRVSVSWPEATVHYPAVLDPTWETAGAMPIAGAFSNAELLAGRTPQQIVVFGFFDGNNPLDTTLFFDVDSATWSVGPPIVAAGSGATSVSFNVDNTNAGAQVFVSGGQTLGADGQWSYVSSTETLSLNTAGQWGWKASAPMQSARALHTATAIPTPTGTKILLAGGLGAGPYANGCDPGATATTAELYDTATGAFVSPPPPNLPAPVFGATAGLSADRQAAIILSGYNGQVDAGGYCSGSSMLFAFRDGQWQTLPSLPVYRFGTRAAQLSDGRFLVTAGSGYTDATQQSCESTTDTQIFTYSATAPYGSWTTADPIPATADGALVSLSNGALLFGPIGTGGTCETAATPTTQVELFDPQTGHWSRTIDSVQPHYNGALFSVVKSTGEHEAVVFGGATSFDPTTYWTYTDTTEIFTLTPNGQPCTVGPDCGTGSCVGGSCQPQGFPISFDATALSNKGLVIVGYSSTPIDTTQPRQLRLPAGTYTLQPYGGLVSSVVFTVKADGTIAYDPTLDGVLSGQGTTALKVNGRQITVQSRLTQTQLALLAYHYNQGAETDQLPFSAQAPQTFTLLPVPTSGYELDVDGDHLADFRFGIDASGLIHIPVESSAYARGENTTTLLITGAHVSITIPTELGDASLSDGIALPAGKTTDFWVLPYSGGSPFTLQLGGQSFTFTVTGAGQIIGDPELLNNLGMHGDGAAYCTSEATQALANGWDYTALQCSGVSDQVVTGEIDAPVPTPTPTSRLTGPGRPPAKLPRNRKAAGGDPVLGDGEFLIDRVDASLAGYGVHYEFRRSYRSGLENDGPLGPGWDHSYDQRIIGHVLDERQSPDYDPTTVGDVIGIDCDRTVQYQDGQGNLELFTYSYWSSAAGNGPVLYMTGENGDSLLEYHWVAFGLSWWRLVLNDGTAITFDRAGFLSAITDLAGNSLNFTWTRAQAPPPPRSDCAAGGYQSKDCAAWLKNVTRYPIGQRRRLAKVNDASRTVYYVYSQSNPLNIYPNDRLACISLENDCNNQVLTSFGYDASGARLTQVTRGAAAVIPSETYKYHAVTSDNTYCLPSADLPNYCHRLCDAPSSAPAACNNQNYTATAQGKCALFACDDGTPAWSCSDWLSLDPFPLKNSKGETKCCTTQLGTQNPEVCQAFLWGGPTCIDGCENNYQCQQTVDNTKYAFYSGGISRELNNDITDVLDDKGNLVVHNDYGEDRTLVSFDHVVRQQIGSASTDNTITFEYHDLLIEGRGGEGTIYNDSNGATAWNGHYSTPDPTGLVATYNLGNDNMVLCPTVCVPGRENCDIVDYNAPYRAGNVADNPEGMKFAVLIHDLHNLTRVQYLDRDFKVLRDVTAETKEVTDYEYKGALLRGVMAASGVRTCLERDYLGRVGQSSVVAAAGYGGSAVTQATLFSYETNGAMAYVIRDWFGTPTTTHYIRDASSRVKQIDQDVRAGAQPLHTYLSYDGEIPPTGILETPTQIVYPNARVDKFSKFDPSMGGPQVIDIDATDATPEHRYAKYDSFGRVREEGEVGRFAQRYAYTDASNVFKLTSAGHSLDGVTWIDVPVQSHVVDGETIVDSVQEATRTTNYANVGRFPTEKDLIATAAPAGTSLPPTQTSCFNYSPDGRLDAEILPEGNGVKYTYVYNTAGRSVIAQKGFGIDTGDSWAAGCRGKSAPSGDPGLGAPAERKYLPGGFLSTEIDDNLVHRQYTTDGFGRVLSIATIPNPQHDDSISVPTQQFGYDVAGHRIWEALRTFGAAYGRPTLPDASVLSYVEYDYDLTGRVTGQRTHVLETGEVLTKTFTYDDVAGTLTITDRGVDTTTTYDHRGRLASTKLPDTSKTTVVHGLGVDTVTVQSNSKGNIVRTYNYDTRGLLSNVQTANGQLLYQATYDDDGNQLTETREGMTHPVIWAYDSFGRLVTETKTLNTTPTTVSTATSTYQYDGNDRVTAFYDAENPVGAGVPWIMTFTGGDAPLTITDPLQRKGSYTYLSDSRWGRTLLATMKEPNGRVSSYAYDSQARLIDVYNGPCATTRNTWECIAPLATQRHMSYDSRGNVGEVDAPSRSSVYLTYDSVGRLVDDKVGIDSAVHHAYLDQGRTQQTQVSYGASIATMTHRYDNMDRLHTVELAGQATPLATYSFGVGVGGPLSLAYSNGATAAYSYDDKLRQTGIDVTFKQPGTTTSTFVGSLHEAFGADSIPRLRQHKIGGKPPLTDVFQVDEDGRMMRERLLASGILSVPTTEIDNSYVSQYMGTSARPFEIDKIGNIRKSIVNNSLLVHTVDKLSRLTALGTTPVTHDGTDNLNGLQGGTPQFSFDQFTGTVSSASVGVSKTTFSYDALDRRRGEHHSWDNTDHLYVWDGQQLVAHGTANSVTLDVPGDDIDAHIVSIDQMGNGSQWFYHQGPDQSTLAVTGSAGVVESYTYTAFGELTIWNAAGNATTKSAFGNIFQFQGQIFDAATSTYSMRARQYQPSWGRFLSPDPISIAGGTSLYAFTSSHPLSSRDPLGLLADTWKNPAAWLNEWMNTWSSAPGAAGETFLFAPEDQVQFDLTVEKAAYLDWLGGGNVIRSVESGGVVHERLYLTSQKPGDVIPDYSLFWGVTGSSDRYLLSDTIVGTSRPRYAEVSPEEREFLREQGRYLVDQSVDFMLSFAKAALQATSMVDCGCRAADTREHYRERTAERQLTLQRSGASAKLARNLLRKTGGSRPANSFAHHIVAWDAKKAEFARKVLEKFGVGVNDAENGVFLGQMHRGLHTNVYYDAVNQMLAEANSASDVRAVLNSIAQQLTAGTFPY